MLNRAVILKALILFLALNLVFAAVYPMDGLGKLSTYNHLFPGRRRLPYGDHPDLAYNLSLYNLEAMFASHEIAASKPPLSEYRVVLIGDSSTWGYLLPVGDTLSEQLNALKLTAPDGRRMRFYNLGYPVMSLTKDLLVLSYAMRYQPDLIIWLITLESMPYDKQLYPPLLQNNPAPVRGLIARYNLHLNPDDPSFYQPGFLERTIVGARRPLADLIRLQLYGIMWSATGIDQEIPQTYTPRQEDLSADLQFHNLAPPHLRPDDVTLDILSAGMSLAGNTPVLLVNEPIFVSSGANSDIRYDFYYPRWAYDDYRAIMNETVSNNQWNYVDAWDLLPGSEFTNSAVHLTPAGSRSLAEFLAPAILSILQRPNSP